MHESFSSLLMPVVAQTYPTLVSNDIIGVQPLSNPSGRIYVSPFKMFNSMKLTHLQILILRRSYLRKNAFRKGYNIKMNQKRTQSLNAYIKKHTEIFPDEYI